MLGYCICLSPTWEADWGVPWHSGMWPTPQKPSAPHVEPCLTQETYERIMTWGWGLTAWRDTLKTDVRTELYEVSRRLLSFFCDFLLRSFPYCPFCGCIVRSFVPEFTHPSSLFLPYWFVHLTAFDQQFRNSAVMRCLRRPCITGIMLWIQSCPAPYCLSSACWCVCTPTHTCVCVYMCVCTNPYVQWARQCRELITAADE